MSVIDGTILNFSDDKALYFKAGEDFGDMKKGKVWRALFDKKKYQKTACDDKNEIKIRGKVIRFIKPL